MRLTPDQVLAITGGLLGGVLAFALGVPAVHAVERHHRGRARCRLAAADVRTFERTHRP